MAEIKSELDDDVKLEAYVERLADLARSVSEAQGEMGRIRNEARRNGVNIEALNYVSSLHARHPNDSGAMIINHVVDYAGRTGVEMEIMPRTELAGAGPVAAAAEETSMGPIRVEVEDEKTQNKWVGQLILGTGITIALMWLLH